MLQSSNPGQLPQGNESEGVRGNVGGQSQAGNEAQSEQEFPSQPFQSLPQVVQIPLATAAIPIPSLNLVLFLVHPHLLVAFWKTIVHVFFPSSFFSFFSFSLSSILFSQFRTLWTLFPSL